MAPDQDIITDNPEDLDGYDLDEINLIDPDNPEGVQNDFDLDKEIIIDWCFFPVLPAEASGFCRKNRREAQEKQESFMTWIPLIDSNMFTGIHTDVLTVAAGIITIALSILGIGIILKVLMR